MNQILFIQPYDLPKISTGKTRQVAYLSRAGFEVGYQIPKQYGFSILDLNVAIHRGKTILDSVREKFTTENPDLVLVTFPSFAQGFQAEAAVRAVRRISDSCKIVIGGGAISLIKDAPLRWWKKYDISGCYDGFGVELPEIIRYLADKETSDLPSGFLVNPENGTAKRGVATLVDGYSAEDLFSAKERFNFLKYLETFRQAGLRPIGLVEMMRGCKHHCSFCAINIKRLGCHFRSAATVADEAEFLAGHKVNHIHLIDPTFGIDKEKAYSLLDMFSSVHGRFETTFEVVTRANIISEKFARSMKKAGVIRCDIGMETMSPSNLQGTEKGINSKTTELAVERIAHQDIQVKLFHIAFPDRISNETLRFLLSLADNEVDLLIQSSYLRALPNSESDPLFLEQDQTVFVHGKDTVHQLMECVLVNLCFKSMDTGYHEDALRQKIKKILESKSSLDSLFGKPKPMNSESSFSLDLLPRLNKHSYTYVHGKGRPFSYGMCRV